MNKQIIFRETKRMMLGVSVLALCILLLGFKSDQPQITITWVSTDRPEFEPGKGEQVTLRYRISAPAKVKVQFLDPFDKPVRTVEKEVKKAGDQNIVWNGRDDAGNLVPPEAYVYTISAQTNDLEGSQSPIVYDLRDRTGGELVHVEKVEWEPKSGRLAYAISKPSRVRVILGRMTAGWPVGTLIDWEPRPAGRNQTQWDGWDPEHVIQAKEMTGLEPVFHAFALPENVVIVTGAGQGNKQTSAASKLDKTPIRRLALNTTSNTVLHQHASHPRSRCYDPLVEMSFPQIETAGELVQLKGKTVLRLNVAEEQPGLRMAPIPRASVFVFVDGALVERNLDGYLPYQWVLDTKNLDPGEHVITGLLAWPDDHFGVTHRRVLVEDYPAGR